MTGAVAAGGLDALDDAMRTGAAASPSGVTMPRLAVTGQLPWPCVHDLPALQAFPRIELGPTQVNCFSGRPVATVRNYAGARLVDILDAAGLTTQTRAVLKRCVIVAGGGDGYRALFSWCELYNAELGDGVLVLYERDGSPLGAGLGPLSLISARDRQLGPRHLRDLLSIQVQML